MSKHTPGPWSLPHFASPDIDCRCGFVLCNSLMGSIATVHCSGEGNWEKAGDNPRFDEACANAHLIAAAPELLEALKELVSSVNATMNSMESAGVKIPFVPCEILLVTLKDEVLEAEAAIAKAEGRTK